MACQSAGLFLLPILLNAVRHLLAIAHRDRGSLPNCNIVCLTGDELKTNASAYLQVLFDADPKAVGGAMPGDDFYWTAE